MEAGSSIVVMIAGVESYECEAADLSK